MAPNGETLGGSYSNNENKAHKTRRLLMENLRRTMSDNISLELSRSRSKRWVDRVISKFLTTGTGPSWPTGFGSQESPGIYVHGKAFSWPRYPLAAATKRKTPTGAPYGAANARPPLILIHHGH
ncbi:hypothetical protein NC652_017721 [Populus alba x Populus x berolinensis]|nr:hypothetical protein NC652_017721 [Populus alba x Populus x berolinensis]